MISRPKPPSTWPMPSVPTFSGGDAPKLAPVVRPNTIRAMAAMKVDRPRIASVRTAALPASPICSGASVWDRPRGRGAATTGRRLRSARVLRVVRVAREDGALPATLAFLPVTRLGWTS